jgi:hypothetical protein
MIPEEELMERHPSDQVATAKTTDFEFGKESVRGLIARHSTFISNYSKTWL